jgi:hypothetical protein
LFQSEGIDRAIHALQNAVRLAARDLPALNLTNALLRIVESIGTILPNVELAYSAYSSITKAIEKLAEQYRVLFCSYDFIGLSESTRNAIQESQFSSLIQLALSHETEMIHDLIGCMANAQYEYLPSVFNNAMAKDTMGAADVAFLKNGRLIPLIESELVYPRGLKTSIRGLTVASAVDIADKPDISYDNKKNEFLTSEASINSKGMNIICTCREIIGTGDLFTEVELMDFTSVLSRTPTAAGLCETGMKIYSWLEDLFKQGYVVDFDCELYYHCRSRQKNSMPFTFDEMKKAPHGLPSAGRFNSVGRAHFYFANTRYGAEVEVKKHLKNDEVLQTVKLKPVKEIHLLDLSNTLQRGASFLKMMRYSVSDNENNKMPKEYLLPGYVADCCQMIGFDGIKYRGSDQYSNYVSWSDGYFTDAGMCE